MDKGALIHVSYPPFPHLSPRRFLSRDDNFSSSSEGIWVLETALSSVAQKQRCAGINEAR
jgi:hypothetical protein